MQCITDHISNDTSCHVTPEMAEQLNPNAMFKEDNICKAIASMRPHTAAGMDGLGIDFYKTHARELAPHLRQLFLDAHSKGHMSEVMRHAVVSLLHKAKISCATWTKTTAPFPLPQRNTASWDGVFVNTSPLSYGISLAKPS